ncbi:RNA polymerase III transcription factor IIIC subunit-domain-containing protein [Phakopsora pachyrhizi]|nr:RNA polymerase III transcription factor IIIC subunit-domain-containing protein [Phakopsora pachyrhizi]
MTDDRLNHSIPDRRLVAIECPVKIGEGDRSRSDPDGRYDGLINRLGGISRLSSQLNERDQNRPVELRLGSLKNDFIHPIPGEWVPSSNLLIKIIKRTKRKKTGQVALNGVDDVVGVGEGSSSGCVTRKIFKVEPVGVIETTVRFRALSDFQFTPNVKHPINVLAKDMKSLNAERVLKFNFNTEPEELDRTMKDTQSFPAPIFSRYIVPQLYKFKSHPSSRIVENPDGSKRLANINKYTGTLPQSIFFDHPEVPKGPLPKHLEIKGVGHEALLKKSLSLFEQRPMWSRLAFQNQLSNSELRALRHNKHFLASVCYMFEDGVFRDLIIKFGYDPRILPESRFYQRMSLRNLDTKKKPDKFTFKLMKRTSGNDEIKDAPRDHIFDGVELHQSIGTYQMCDITDPLLVNLIRSEKGVLPHCRVRDGWYTSNALEQIRFNFKTKENRLVRDTECVDLLEIDVRPEAPDLLKKVSKAQKRLGGNNVSFAGPNLILNDPSSSNSNQYKQNSKHFLPNPLLKNRSRTKRIGPKRGDFNDVLDDKILKMDFHFVSLY